MLRKYCDWLNLWQSIESEPYNFTPAEFRGGYGQVELVTHYLTDWYLAVVYTLGYGDEGGPATVTAYFTACPGCEVDTEPTYMVQEFDTYIQIILDGGEWAATPKEKGY